MCTCRVGEGRDARDNVNVAAAAGDGEAVGGKQAQQILQLPVDVAEYLYGWPHVHHHRIFLQQHISGAADRQEQSLELLS